MIMIVVKLIMVAIATLVTMVLAIINNLYEVDDKNNNQRDHHRTGTKLTTRTSSMMTSNK